MGLQRETKPSDEVRAPAVPRGKAIIVTRYREAVAKVALVNPDDLAMLEESHELLEEIVAKTSAAASAIARKALQLEDRPDSRSAVEDVDRIAKTLDS